MKLTQLSYDSDDPSGILFRQLIKLKDSLTSETWSIAELDLDFADLEIIAGWLKNSKQKSIKETHERGWSKSLDPKGKYTNKVVLGLLLHTLYAEVVRRYGTEGSYWSCIYEQLPWKDCDRHQLFQYNGQPNAFHRELLENSAQALKMRHTFGVDGVQQWFSTGFLQFGFTYKGFKNRLGEWLAGYHISTNAIEALCSDPRLNSLSFGKLWEDLSRYREGQLTDSQLENRIKDSCWILPEWFNDLKKTAKEKLHLGTKGGRRADQDDSPEFISSPLLEFNSNGQPTFKAQLINLIELPLTAESYTLTLDEVPKLQLIRQKDGAYEPTSSEELSLPWGQPRVIAAIEDSRTGNQIISQNLELWQPDEFLRVFAENGKRYNDPYALKANPGNIVHIFFPSVLCVELDGRENSRWSSPDNNWTIISLSPEVNLRLTLEDEIFWELKAALKPSDQLIQGRAFIEQSLSVSFSKVDIQSGLLLTTLEVRKPDSISIRWARLGFEQLSFEQKSLRAVLPVSPEYLERGVSIQFSVRAFDRPFIIRKRIQIPFKGAFWIRQDGVKWETPKVLHTQDASQMKLCVAPRNLQAGEIPNEHCITEGYHFSRRLTGRAIQLSGLSGIGSPLLLQRGLFNQTHKPHVLAEAVYDGGCIHQVKISDDYLTIFPSGSVELKESFTCLIWVGTNEDMCLEHLNLSSGTVSDSEHLVWRAAHQYQEESINAIGIFYEGECIGSWWNLPKWTHILRACNDEEKAEEYAKITRIFNCPILYNETFDYVSTFVKEFPSEALLTWLKPRVVLRINKNTELVSNSSKYNEWLRSSGIIFEESKPEMDIADASLIVEEVSDSAGKLDDDSLTKVAYILTSATPALTSQVFDLWLQDYANYKNSASANKTRKHLIASLEPSEAEIEDIATNTIRADVHFVQQHCREFGLHGFNLPPALKENLPFLFEHSITRRLAAAEHLRHHPIT